MLEVNKLSLLIATQHMSQEWPGSLVCGVRSVKVGLMMVARATETRSH